MGMPNNTPISGINGVVKVGTYSNYPAATWAFEMHSSSVPCKSLPSKLFVDVLPGFKTAKLTASGVCRVEFNPFVAARREYINQYKPIIVTAYNLGGVRQIARADSALITDWHWRDDANGMATWQIVALADWQFYNFGDELT